MLVVVLTYSGSLFFFLLKLMRLCFFVFFNCGKFGSFIGVK